MLGVLEEAGVKASFFVTFGPDQSGRALRRLLEPGFAAKMLRTRAWRLYGVRTLLAGTVLPAHPVGEDFPAALARIEAAGHELALHGWNHAEWIQRVDRQSLESLRQVMDRARASFERVVGHPARASAAPGWRPTPSSLRLQERHGLRYASDLRGRRPFHPRIAGRRLGLLQVPTTLPTSDELIGPLAPEELPDYYLSRILEDPSAPHVLTVHAESEGLLYVAWLRELLRRARLAGVHLRPLRAIASEWSGRAPTLSIEWSPVPGRAGRVACAVETSTGLGRLESPCGVG